MSNTFKLYRVKLLNGVTTFHRDVKTCVKVKADVGEGFRIRIWGSEARMYNVTLAVQSIYDL